MDGNKTELLDDSVLLQDRLLRSLHRNKDGHLAASKKTHEGSILDTHNIATLYVYTADEDSFALHEHYVFSHDPQTYKEWLECVIYECFKLQNSDMEHYYGVYGWLTGHLRITPLRNGDLFVKIDREGAKGVRLTFNPAKDKHETHNKKKQKSRQ